MASVIDRFKWRVTTGYQLLERMPAVRELLEQTGQRIADAAGGGDDFVVLSKVYRGGAHVIVATNSEAGRRAEAEDRALTRALDAGR